MKVPKFIAISSVALIGLMTHGTCLKNSSISVLDLRQMEVQQLFENSIEPFENFLAEDDSILIVFIYYPDCQSCYRNYFENNQESLRHQTSMLIFTSLITHGQAYKGLQSYIGWFDKVFLLKNSNQSVKNFIDKQTLVVLQMKTKDEFVILQRVSSPNFY